MITLWARDAHHKQNWVGKGKTFAQGCYLHGKLEEKNGFDLFDMEEKDFNAIVEKGNGVERVFVALSNGKSEIADMYFWRCTDYENYETAKKFDELYKEKFKDKRVFEIPDYVFENSNDMKYFKHRIETRPICALVVLPWDKENVDYVQEQQKLRAAFI